MTISGFTMVRNADKFYFPIKESILSILPIVDEFVIALGKGDDHDRTEELIRSINSPKIKIFHREWDEKSMVDGLIYAEETNYALSKCSGDWCFYLQADELMHEQEHQQIVQACRNQLNNDQVDGLLFNYRHFWADYNHYLPYHGWYRNEIRLFKNDRGIYSFRDAQSFRKKNDEGDNQKLNVVKTDIHVHHYGWVRPPSIMQSKKKEQDVVHYKTKKEEQHQAVIYDYGALGKIPEYKGTHPKVFHDWMELHDWNDQLNFSKKANLNRDLFKHERFKYRFISWIENNLNGGKTILGYSNWKIVG